MVLPSMPTISCGCKVSSKGSGGLVFKWQPPPPPVAMDTTWSTPASLMSLVLRRMSSRSSRRRSFNSVSASNTSCSRSLTASSRSMMNCSRSLSSAQLLRPVEPQLAFPRNWRNSASSAWSCRCSLEASTSRSATSARHFRASLLAESTSVWDAARTSSRRRSRSPIWQRRRFASCRACSVSPCAISTLLAARCPSDSMRTILSRKRSTSSRAFAYSPERSRNVSSALSNSCRC
mmetsp:Transcript_45348/g.125852  ORF Transcript_45348/g.125852 Transcript_45348/m.125852 type:complete len:234 (+) Transcript_45348:781-1482(+)